MTVSEEIRQVVEYGMDISSVSDMAWLAIYDFVRSDEWIANLNFDEGQMFGLFVAEALES